MAHMILENDNMFSVNETPWHGLGVVLPNSPGIDEALQISGLDWQVRTLGLTAHQPSVAGKITRTTLPLTGFRALQRSDTAEVFTVVSSNYQVLQNSEAFEVFRPMVESGDITLETAGSLNNGRRVWILAKVTGAKDAEIQDGDIVKPFVLLSNSHDGTQAVRFGFTPVRVVCNNTLTMAEGSQASKLIRVRHRGNLTGQMDLLRETLDLGAAGFRATVKQYRKLAKARVVKEEDMRKYIRLALDINEDKSNTPRENSVIQVILNGKGLGVRGEGVTLWDLYNGVNEWGLYHRGRTDDARLNSMWFADGYAMDQRALQTAIEWAKAA